MNKKIKFKTPKIGDDKMHKPVTAEYVGCVLVLVPLFIFLLFAIIYILMRQYGYSNGWEMLSDFWHKIFT